MRVISARDGIEPTPCILGEEERFLNVKGKQPITLSGVYKSDCPADGGVGGDRAGPRSRLEAPPT